MHIIHPIDIPESFKMVVDVHVVIKKVEQL